MDRKGGIVKVKLTGEQYIALLLERQSAWIEKHGTVQIAGVEAPPLLEWFVREGDEEIFKPPG